MPHPQPHSDDESAAADCCNHVAWADIDRHKLAAAFSRIRQATERLSAGLSSEDQNLQSMAETSPVKWHRAHTSWFFETFILREMATGYRPWDDRFSYLFNSYYNVIGRQYPRARRGLISRPDTVEVSEYRAHVDRAILQTISDCQAARFEQLKRLVTLGLNHEQQHQELMVTDIKHAFSHSPLDPALTAMPAPGGGPTRIEWLPIGGGIHQIGASGDQFCFDNETPRHRVWLEDFQIASRPVTCGEYLDFMADGGYLNSALWLADGWDWCRRNGVEAPLYWERSGERWHLYTLGGSRPVDPHETLCHISFYEADAYARWAGARLPTEAEWEVAADSCQAGTGEFADSGRFHPAPAVAGIGLNQMFGTVWEWTASSYAAYPGFRAAGGALGEYNGKFMSNQMVLRGGSCATPAGHVRSSYRNFFYPSDRWQFSGLRLARPA